MHFSTLFLVVAVVTVPLHVLYGFAYRNVIATREIHDQISELPNYRQVRSVGPRQLTHAERVYWALAALELALIPLGVRAARRAIEVEESGGVATIRDSWRAALTKDDRARVFAPHTLPSIAIGALTAVALGGLLEVTGSIAIEFVDVDFAWIGLGLVQALARAAAAPFILATVALARVAKATPLSTPKLY